MRPPRPRPDPRALGRVAVAVSIAVVAASPTGCTGRAGAGAGARHTAEAGPLSGSSWREALPAGASLVVGADVARLLTFPPARELLASLPGGGAAVYRAVEGAAADCGFDLADLGEVVLASFGPENPNALALAAGRFDEDTVARCMQTLLALRGGSVREEVVGGHRALTSARASDNAWVAVPGPRLLVVAGTRAWLARTLADATPRFPADRTPLSRLLAYLPRERAAFAAGEIAPDSEPARLARGVAGAAMAGFYAWVAIGDALSVEVGAVLETPEGATRALRFLRTYVDESKAELEALGLLAYASRIELSAEGPVARARLALDRGEVERLVAALGEGHRSGSR